MNPLLLKFADGTSFLVGMGLVILAVALRVGSSRRWPVGVIAGMLGVVGAVLVVLSSTPLAISSYVIWGGFLVATAIVLGRRTPEPSRGHMRLLPAGLLVAVCLLLASMEASRRWSPRIPVRHGQTVVVVGDSISAGVGTGERTWPGVLASLKHLAVTNLAQGGATVKSALGQVKAIQQQNALVLVEIGGNDILGTTDSATFREQLDALLGHLHRAGHRLVLFELPLPPLRNRFGKAQRDLARKYDAVLIPKRCFAEVLGLPDGTTDGLHLSQKGHDAMAQRVGEMLEIEE
jgi:acyl-CoA thioesterase-1